MLLQPNKFHSTSYHNDNIHTTPNKLIELCAKYNIKYEENNDGEDKTNFDFEFQTLEGLYFTVYDWKEYKILNKDRKYSFHIGAKDKLDSIDALYILQTELTKL